MQFIRKRKKSHSQKHRRHWFSEDQYRIIWRREVSGIHVTPRFQACVRVIIPNYSGGPARQMWDFVNRSRRLYKTMKAAEEDCERHKRLWSKACEASGIRALIDIFGRLPAEVPVWVRKQMNPKALAVLMAPRRRKYEEEDECEPNLNDPTSPSQTSDSSISLANRQAGSPRIPTPGPASPVVAKELEKDHTDTTSFPATAEEPAAAPAKQSRKHTAKPSASGGKKRKSTKGSSKPARRPSKGSRQTKSKR